MSSNSCRGGLTGGRHERARLFGLAFAEHRLGLAERPFARGQRSGLVLLARLSGAVLRREGGGEEGERRERGGQAWP